MLVKKGTELYVNMSNELVRSAHGLSLSEKRLLMLAVSKLDSKKTPTPKNMVTRINVSEMISEFGFDKKSAYAETRKAAEGIKNRYIRFFHTDTDGEKIETVMNWVGRSSYKKSEGWVELAFWHELSPMLFELESLFTSYKLSRAGGLRSVYSWRVFELIMQFKSTGKLEISVDKFADLMEVPKTYRNDFGAMRRKVVEPAIKEIREKDGLDIKWEAIKKGRKVNSLYFSFPKEQQIALPLSDNKEKAPKRRYTRSDIESNGSLAHPGESYTQALKRLNSKRH